MTLPAPSLEPEPAAPASSRPSAAPPAIPRDDPRRRPLVGPIRGIDVRRFRRLIGVTQETLAKWFKVSVRTIQHWEGAGTRSIKLHGGQDYFFREAFAAAIEEDVPEEIGACLEDNDPGRAWLCVFETGRRNK